MTTMTADRTRRGMAATVLLVLLTAAAVLLTAGAVLGLVAARHDGGHSVTGAALVVGLHAAQLVGLLAIWTWHRWGLFLYGVALAAVLVLSLLSGGWFVFTLVPLALFAALAVLLRGRWPS